MKKLIMIVMVIVLSCKKDDPEPFNAKNKFDATITHLPSGEVTQFSARGANVVFGCGMTGSWITADQTPETSMSISVINGLFDCITGPDVYWISCTYFPRNKFASSLRYSTLYPDHLGSVKYTAFDGKYAEGYFAVVCKEAMGKDSVSVRGTFSGYLK